MKIWLYNFLYVLLALCYWAHESKSTTNPRTANTTTEMDAESDDPTVIADLIVEIMEIENKDLASECCVDILRGRTSEQRKQIQNALFRNYGMPGRYIFKKTFGHKSYFAGLMEAMLYNQTELNAYILAESIKSSSEADSRKIIEVLATQGQKEIMNIEKTYSFFSNPKHTLGEQLFNASFSSGFKHLVSKLLYSTVRFKNNSVSIKDAKQSAIRLFNYRNSKNIHGIVDIFVENNRNQLLTIFKQFHEQYFTSIESGFDIRYKFCCLIPKRDTDIRRALLDIIAITRHTTSYFAKRLDNMFEIMETTYGYFYRDPASIMMPRQYVDLRIIIAYYRQFFGKEVMDEFRQMVNFPFKRSYIRAIKDVIENSV